MTDLDKIMVDILGKDAYFSTDYKVTDSVRLLSKAFHYLFIQMGQVKGMLPSDDQDYIETIKNNAILILKNQ